MFVLVPTLLVFLNHLFDLQSVEGDPLGLRMRQVDET